MKQKTQGERVKRLLTDLCSQMGYSIAMRHPERFQALVNKGAEALADAVLIAEGLDPQLEKHLRNGVIQFVSERLK